MNQAATSTEPSAKEIVSILARELWQSAGCPSGRDLDFWLQAEAKLFPRPDPSRSKPAGKPNPVEILTSAAKRKSKAKAK